MKKYLDILGLLEGATQSDIKAAYRRMAGKYHPDREGGDEEMFKKVQEAYEFLSGERQDGPKPQTEEQRVYSILVQAWVQSADPFDRPSRQLETVRGEISKGVRDIPKSKEKLEKEREKLETLRGLIESPDSGLNAYEDMLSMKIAQVSAQIDLQKDLQKALVIIEAMIKEYKLTAYGQKIDREMAEKEAPRTLTGLEQMLLQQFGRGPGNGPTGYRF